MPSIATNDLGTVPAKPAHASGVFQTSPGMLRKRLLATCARAVAGGIRFIELQTNATLIDATYAQQLAAAGVTSAFVSTTRTDSPSGSSWSAVTGASIAGSSMVTEPSPCCSQ